MERFGMKLGTAPKTQFSLPKLKKLRGYPGAKCIVEAVRCSSCVLLSKSKKPCATPGQNVFLELCVALNLCTSPAVKHEENLN